MTKTTTRSAPFGNLAWIAILLLAGLLGASSLRAQPVSWTGAGSPNNTNWSTSANWSGGTPGPNATILFTNAGSVATVSNINNVVDTTTTIQSLQYATTNTSGTANAVYHTTLINPGVTLTVSTNAAAPLLVVGTLTDNGVSQIEDATITGNNGTLVVSSTNAGSLMFIQQGSSGTGTHNAILDLSGLGTFNLTAGRLLLAANDASGVNASNYTSGTLLLAYTNVIQLNGNSSASPTLAIGVAVSNPNPTCTNLLELGQTNSFYLDTMIVGGYKSSSPGSIVKFNPALAGNNPALYLRGDSATRVATLAIGDDLGGAGTGTGSSALGTMDLSLGTMNAQVNNCFVGRSEQTTNTGSATGTLILGAGVFNVNTLNLGTVGTNNNRGGATGTVTITNSLTTLVVNSALVMGVNANTNFSFVPAVTPVATAILNLTNGTVYANAITSPSTNGVIGTVNVNNGTLYLTNTAGTPSQPLAAVNLTTATLHLNASTAVTNIVATNVATSGTTTITIDSISGYIGGTMTFPLISYSAGTDPFTSLSLSSLGAYTGSLQDNSGNKRIDLQITAGPVVADLGSVVWGGGVSGNWDTTSLNWTNGSVTTLYGDTDLVTFNDWGQTGIISLGISVAPGSVTVSNVALAYSISGAGSIGGSGSLTKLGTGTLTLGTANSYGGGTVVNGGTITTTVAGALPAATTVNFSAATNATLNLQGTAQTLAGMTFGNGNSNLVNTFTITGTTGSALTVSPATLTIAPASTSNSLALNMAGLSSFTYANAGGTLAVNGGTAQQSPVGQTTATLAGTNSITAATLAVGNVGTSGGIANSTLNLGATNTLDVGTITLGNGRSDGTIQFGSGITGGTLTIAGATGGSSTTTLSGNHDSFQASDHPVDLFDATAGTLNAQFGAMTLGSASPTANSHGRGVTVTSSFKMGAGTLTAASLTMGNINNAANATNYTITITSLFSITNGGTASITNLTLANNNLAATLQGAADNLTNNATVLLTNGATLNLTTVQTGNAASPALTTTVLNWGDGTVGNIPGGSLTVNGISIALIGSANNHKVNITSGQTGAINSWISGTGTITDVGAGALTLAGNNSFTGSLIMNGTNTLTLTKTNTYTGSTLINSGTLLLGAVASISNSPTINVASNALFDVSAVTGGFVLGPSQTLTGNGSVNGSVTAAPGAQITPGGVGAVGTLTFSNGLTLNGQALTFDMNTNPASGNDLLNVGGTLTLNANATILLNELGAALGSGTYTLMNYGSLQANSRSFVLTAPRGTSLNVGATSLTLTVGVAYSANLIWAGDGVLNNWDVQTTTNWVNGGSLDYFYQFDNVTFDDTGSASPAINLTTTLAPGSVTMSNNVHNYTFSGSGQFAGSMALTNDGTGTLTLNTSNTYSGGTVINNGTVQLTFTNAGAALPDLAAGTGPITIMPSGTLSITNNGGAPTHIIMTNVINGSGVITLPQNQEVSFNGPGAMSGFNGAINIPAGATTTAKGDVLGSAVNLSASATINVTNGGTLWVGAAGVTVPATNNLAGNGNGEGWGALRVDTGAVYSGPVNLTGNATIGAENGASGTISGVISDGGLNYSLAKLGAATVILTGANTYGGGTIVSNGTLQVGTGIISNGTLPGNVNIAGTNAILAFVVATNTTQTYNGAISGSGSLYLGYSSGAGFDGTLVVNGNNTFTNGVNINGGGMWITNVAALGTGSKVINISAGTAGHPALHLNGTNGNILLPSTLSFLTSWAGSTDSPGAVINEAGNNEIDGNFNVTSGGGGTTIVVNGGTLKLTGTLAPSTTGRTLLFDGAGNGTVSGVIADGTTPNLLTGVTISGPGIWTFAGINTYVTNTYVTTGGTLLVNGSIGTGSVSVQTSAVLGGGGTIGGNVTFNSGTQATNNEGSPLTISGSLTLNNNTLNVATPSPLGPGSYTLMTYHAAGSSGSFNSTPVISGAGLAANTTGTVVTGGGTVTLHVVGTTTLALTSSTNAVTYGQSATFTAGVQLNGVTAGAATGTILFSLDGTPVATNGVAGGQAAYANSALTVPSHTITAVYSGDANYLTSTNSLAQTVNPAALTITANNTNLVYNGVAFAGGNGVTYAGFVNGQNNTVLTGALTYGGTAQGATSAGSYTIVPSGLSGANYAITYVSGTLTITQANPGTNLLVSSVNPSGFLGAVTFTNLLPVDATGSVVFSSTNGPISTNSVSSGLAMSLSVTNLPRGTNAITATYSGDANYLGATVSLNQIVTNHPPVASVMTVTRTAGLPLLVALASVATNWSDPDGDTVELTGVNMQSTNGVNLMALSWVTNTDGSIATTNANAYLGYPNSPNVNDQISYGISDSYGGTNIGYINILIQASVAGTNAIANIATGNPTTLTAYGIPGYNYILERATNLAPVVWVDIATNAAATNGVINETDTFWDLGGVPPASAFYQLKWQP